jgi:hypothetical protein
MHPFARTKPCPIGPREPVRSTLGKANSKDAQAKAARERAERFRARMKAPIAAVAELAPSRGTESISATRVQGPVSAMNFRESKSEFRNLNVAACATARRPARRESL